MPPRSPSELLQLTVELRSEPDVERTVDRAVELACSVTGCDDAGLALVQGDRGIEVAAAADERAVAAEHMQWRYREGPWFELMAGRETLMASETVAHRLWPNWGPEVVGLGLRSCLGIRLFTRRQVVGLLDLYFEEPASLTVDEVAGAQLFGRYAAAAVAAAWEDDRLYRTMQAGHVIGQAEGILMQRFNLDGRGALGALRRYAEQARLSLSAAAGVIASRQEPKPSL